MRNMRIENVDPQKPHDKAKTFWETQHMLYFWKANGSRISNIRLIVWVLTTVPSDDDDDDDDNDDDDDEEEEEVEEEEEEEVS